MDKLHELLRSKPLIFDGAWGTELIKRTGKKDQPPEVHNSTNAELIAQLAAEYFEAGADICTTNTFAATSFWLGKDQPDIDIASNNQCAVEAVRSVKPSNKFIAGSIGPSGLLHKTNQQYEALKESYAQQTAILAAAGIDLFILETFFELRELQIAFAAVKQHNLPVIVSMTFNTFQGAVFAFDGTTPEQLVRHFQGEKLLALGSNCSLDVKKIVRVAECLFACSGFPIIIQPVGPSGESTVTAGEIDRFAGKLTSLVEKGVRLVGGCCGTTPAHIAALAKRLNSRIL